MLNSQEASLEIFNVTAVTYLCDVLASLLNAAKNTALKRKYFANIF